MNEDDEPQTPEEVTDRIDNLIGVMMELNADMLQRARQSARMWSEIQMDHLRQAERAFEIAQLCAMGAKMVSDATGDLLTAEFDLGDKLSEAYGLDSDDDEEGDDDEDPSD